MVTDNRKSGTLRTGQEADLARLTDIRCKQQKGLKIYAWALMSNHLHMIVSAGAEQTVAEIVRGFKKFTGKRILATLD